MNKHIHAIRVCKGRITPQLFYDFSVDYGIAVADELQIAHRVYGKINPYIIREAERMMELIAKSVRVGYDRFDNNVNVDSVLERIDPAELAHREFSTGIKSRLAKITKGLA